MDIHVGQADACGTSPSDIDGMKCQLYREFFQLSPDAVIILNTLGVLTECNDRLIEWLGYTRAELVGKSLPDLPFLSIESKALVAKNFVHRIAGNPIEPYELEMTAKNGTLVYGIVKGAIACDASGKPLADLAIISNVTKLKEEQNARTESEQRYKTLFDNVIDAVVLIDIEKGSFVEYNEKACAMLGYAHEEFGALSLKDIEGIEDEAAIQKHIKQVIEIGSDTFKTQHKKKDGTMIDVYVRASKVVINGNVYLQSVWTDITKQKALEDAMKEKLDELERLSKLMVGRELKMVELKEELERLKVSHDTIIST